MVAGSPPGPGAPPGQVHPPGPGTPPGRYTPLGPGAPPGRYTPPGPGTLPRETATVADGTHPTGMHSYLAINSHTQNESSHGNVQIKLMNQEKNITM